MYHIWEAYCDNAACFCHCHSDTKIMDKNERIQKHPGSYICLILAILCLNVF